MKYALLGISLCALAAAPPAFAGPMGNGGALSSTYSGNGLVNSESNVPRFGDMRKKRAVDALIREGREMQAADGGTLTLEHHTYLQAKLNAILNGNY